jgi:hypothetical protein
MAFADTPANIKVAGISSWKVRETSGSKTEFIPLPFLREGKITEKTLFIKDALGRQIPHSVELTASAKMFAITSLANGIEVLDNLAIIGADHQITGVSGITWDTSLLTPTTGGTKVKLVIDGGFEDVMYAEIGMDRVYTITQTDTIHGTPTAGSANGVAGTIDNFKNLTIADVGTAAVTKIECGSGGYTDVFASIRNPKMTFEFLTYRDALGRSKSFGIQVDIEAESFQASSAEALDLNVLAGRQNDWKITFLNGRIATLASQLGVHFELTSAADSDDLTFIKLQASGIVPISAWDGIWT